MILYHATKQQDEPKKIEEDRSRKEQGIKKMRNETQTRSQFSD